MASQRANTTVTQAEPAFVPVTDIPPSKAPEGRRLSSIVGFIILGVIGASAYWGHQTDWKFVSSRTESSNDDRNRPAATVSTVIFGPPETGAANLPPALRTSATLAFESAERVEKAGIDVAGAWTSAMTESISASGELQFEPSRVARLSARVPGTAWRVFKSIGDRVKVGDVMAIVDAADVGKAKADFQQALVQVQLKHSALTNLVSAGNAVSPRHRQEAEAASREAEVRLLSAEQALVNLGLPVNASDYRGLGLDEVIRRMRWLGIPDAEKSDAESSSGSANLLPIRSTLDGVILSAAVVVGEVVDPGRVLFVVVDPTRLWLTLHVGQDDARRVAIGQTVLFRPDGLTRDYRGQVTWIGTTADEVTRRIPVRVELPNADGTLRASSLGLGRIVLREEPNAVVVPNEAIQTVFGANVVFVRDPSFLKADGQKAFHIRVVRIGARDDQNTEIIEGLQPKEIVASKGAPVLLNEWRRAVSDRAEIRSSTP